MGSIARSRADGLPMSSHAKLNCEAITDWARLAGGAGNTGDLRSFGKHAGASNGFVRTLHEAVTPALSRW